MLGILSSLISFSLQVTKEALSTVCFPWPLSLLQMPTDPHLLFLHLGDSRLLWIISGRVETFFTLPVVLGRPQMEADSVFPGS